MPEMHKCINDTHQNRDQSLYSNVELSKPFLSPKVVKTEQKYIFKRIYSVDMSIQQIAFFFTTGARSLCMKYEHQICLLKKHFFRCVDKYYYY